FRGFPIPQAAFLIRHRSPDVTPSYKQCSDSDSRMCRIRWPRVPQFYGKCNDEFFWHISDLLPTASHALGMFAILHLQFEMLFMRASLYLSRRAGALRRSAANPRSLFYRCKGPRTATSD